LTVNVLQNQFSISTLIGGTSATDDVRGSVIQADGTIVLAANISDAALPNVVPTLLNNATATTSGTIIRLASDGKTVLSATRLAQKLTDLAADAQGNLFVAAGTEGAFKLNAAASQIVWQKSFTKYVHRIDAGTSGKSIVMTASETDSNDETLTGGSVFVYDVDGTELSQLGAPSQYTTDVTIDEASGTVITIGFKNFNTPGELNGQSLPVYVPVYRGYALNGTPKYVGYDWSSDQNSPRWLNRSANNMADDRAVRCAMGKDGKLYIMHEVYGGNHCMRYSPYDIMQTVPIVGGDMYFNFANTGTRVKIFVGRHEPSTGAYILGQQFTPRINPPLNGDNTVFVRTGDIAADSDGRVYMTGQSASGLPLTVDHEPGEYTGGAFLLILSPNLATREACLRLTNGKGHTVSAISANQYVFGGTTFNPLYAVNKFQTAMSTPNDGWFAVKSQLQSVPTQRLVQKITPQDPSVSKGVLSVFPNPTQEGMVNVELKGLKDLQFTLEIVNLAGRTIYSSKGKGDTVLDLLRLKTEAGAYIIRLTTAKYVLTERLMIF
jgi:Secretion system C-terminal sorting domain